MNAPQQESLQVNGFGLSSPTVEECGRAYSRSRPVPFLAGGASGDVLPRATRGSAGQASVRGGARYASGPQTRPTGHRRRLRREPRAVAAQRHHVVAPCCRRRGGAPGDPTLASPTRAGLLLPTPGPPSLGLPRVTSCRRGGHVALADPDHWLSRVGRVIDHERPMAVAAVRTRRPPASSGVWSADATACPATCALRTTVVSDVTPRPRDTVAAGRSRRRP